jgi:mandelate racemase
MTGTVVAVRARAVSLTPARPVQTAAGALTTTPLVLVDVTTSDGATGRSYLRCYTPLVLAPLAQLVTELGAAATGGPAAPLAASTRLRASLRLIGERGLVGLALAGLDMALWDALAVTAGQPLATLLGGAPTPVPAYASLRTMAPDGAAREAEDALAAGFRAVKVKLGAADLAADLATIRAVRAAIGAAARLMVDYNQSLTVAEACRRVAVLDGEGLEWIEEPVDATDLAGQARVAAAARTPIQTGESWDEVASGIAAGAADLLTLDVMRLGGVTGWLRAAAHAHTAGLEVASHSFGEFSAHLLAVTPTARWWEYLDHVGELLVEPLQVHDGQVTAPDRPGAGLDWDEQRVSRALA